MEKMQGMGLYLAMYAQGTTLETWSWVGEHCFKGTGRSSQDQYPEEEREFEQRSWYNLWPVWPISVLMKMHDAKPRVSYTYKDTHTHTATLKKSVAPSNFCWIF